MATILLTGVTGTVGSSLASILKIRGHRLIYLIRPRDGQNSSNRLFQILGKTTGEEIVWDGDVTLAHIGVSVSERIRWKGKIDKIVHCAASLNFDEASARETAEVNVGGTRNVLEMAEELEISEVHYFSTVYVAGDSDYFSEDDFDIGQNCRNVYERTKKEAEGLVKNWKKGRYSIYRLGIAVGSYANGHIPTFNGYYVFASSLWHLRRGLMQKSEVEREKYRLEGISFNNEEMLTLPIYLNFSPTSTLNLVPIDWVAKVSSDLIHLPADNQVFHIVHPRPRKARWINDVSLKHLGVKGFYYGDFADYSSRSLLGRLQKIFDRSTAQYTPYITHECRFETINALRVLEGNYAWAPDIDEDFIIRMLNYAKSVDFGRQKNSKR